MCLYTITSAIVVDGLRDLLAVPGVPAAANRERSRDVIHAVLRRWAREAFTATVKGGGFFWYSVVFYPRMVAHVLLGLAERDFRGAVR